MAIALANRSSPHTRTPSGCTALSACFDLAMAYRAPEWAALPDSLASEGSSSIFPKLFGHLASPMPLVRAVAAEGFAKLLVSARLRGSAGVEREALTALTLVFFSPHTDDGTSLRQCLAVFFPTFVRRSPSSMHLLESVFLHCLRYAPTPGPHRSIPLTFTASLTQLTNDLYCFFHVTDDCVLPTRLPRHVMHAPKTCSISRVSVSQLGQYLISVIASADVEGAKPIQSSATQERIAVSLCNEILCDPDAPATKHLIKVLQSCNLSEAGPSVLCTLHSLSSRAANQMSDGVTASLMVKFCQQIRQLSDAGGSEGQARESSSDFESEREAYLTLCTQGVWVAMFPAVEGGEEATTAARKKVGGAGVGGKKGGTAGRSKAPSRGGGARGAKGKRGGDEGAEEEEEEGGPAQMLSPHSPINVRRSARTRKATVAKVQQDVDKLLAEQEKREKEDWLRRGEEGLEDEEDDEEDDDDE
mmetsp:Transcript_40294/g.97970  ORF Transcript_40294/g.97970 Transcript_40294/m.97970 type:complete len:473 (-) Transcript_40294:155-1573(-)